MIKKIFAVTMAAVMMFSMAGCLKLTGIRQEEKEKRIEEAIRESISAETDEKTSESEKDPKPTAEGETEIATEPVSETESETEPVSETESEAVGTEGTEDPVTGEYVHIRIFDEGDYLTLDEETELTQKILKIEEKYRDLNFHIIAKLTNKPQTENAQADGETFGWNYSQYPMLFNYYLQEQENGEFSQVSELRSVNDLYLYFDETKGEWYHGEFAAEWIMEDEDFDNMMRTDGVFLIVGDYYGAVNAFIDEAEKVLARAAKDKGIDSGSEDESEPTPGVVGNQDDFSTDDWGNFEIKVNGNLVKLPCSYTEFAEKTGFSFEGEDSQQTLKGRYESFETVYNSDEARLTLDLYNPGESMTTYDKCDVIGLMYYQSDYSDPVSIVFPNGASEQSGIDEVIAAFGTPTRDSLDEYEPGRYITWMPGEFSYEGKVEISFYNKKLTEIDVSAPLY